MSEDKNDTKAPPTEEKLTKPAIEQDNRVAKAKADAEAKGGGAKEPEKGLNQDG